MSEPGNGNRTLRAQQAAAGPDRGFLKPVAVGIGAAAALGVFGVLGWTLLTPPDVAPPRAQPPVIQIRPIPTPPPPPPPPKVDPPPQRPIIQEMPRPEPAPAPKPPSPAPSAPKIAGPPALPGLPSGPGPIVVGPRCDVGCDGTPNGRGPGGGGGDAERYFQQQATQRVVEALRRDDRTRGSNAQVAVTYDDAGRIVRVRLLRGTGNAERDRAIAETLTGLLVAKPPPARRTLILELNENV